MLGAAESPLGDREGGATAIFEKSGSPDSADPADFCNKIGQQGTLILFATRGRHHVRRQFFLRSQSPQPLLKMRKRVDRQYHGDTVFRMFGYVGLAERGRLSGRFAIHGETCRSVPETPC